LTVEPTSQLQTMHWLKMKKSFRSSLVLIWMRQASTCAHQQADLLITGSARYTCRQ